MKKIVLLSLSIAAAALLLTGTGAAQSVDKPGTATLVFDANMTTGYSWSGFVLGGTSVELDSMEGSYIEDPNPQQLDGVGGETHFLLTAVDPGESILSFIYARPWEEAYETPTVILASVDEDLNITTMDVTESGVLSGTVTDVNEEEFSVILDTEQAGEVIARFPENDSLPVKDEQINIFTNGTMTMSIPAIVNVIAWNTIPSELARDKEPEPDLAELALKNGTLCGVAFSNSGDENGNYYFADLSWTEDATLVLTTEDQPSYDQPTQVSRYDAADNTLARIAGIINDNGMENWGDRPDYYEVCDAAHPYLHLYILTADDEWEDISISGYIEFTEEENDAYAAVLDLLFEHESEEYLIESYTRTE